MKLTKSKIFLIFCLSFITGVLIAPVLSKLAVTITAITFVMLVSIGWSSKWAKLIGLAGLILLLGTLRFQSVVARNNLAHFYDQKADVVGSITEEPDVRADKTYLTVSKLEINGQKINDKILVSVYNSRNFAYGDKISFKGKILEPKEFPDFNYKNYLSRFGIDAVVYYPNPEVIASGEGNKIKAALLTVKQKFTENLSQILPEPQNAFAAALLVGNKRAIPEWLTNAFNITGTSHVVAISGFNITIIVSTLDLILSRFGRRATFLVNLPLILGFVILTGASASVVRASIVVGLVLLAKNIGRLYHPTNALALCAAVMLIINPKLLLFDVGFQLSFLALAGIVYISPIINPFFHRWPKVLREAIVATISAQIFALPVLLFNFDQLSLVSPLANLLVLPPIPLTMLFGFLAGLSGFVWQQLASVMAWPAWILLSYIIQIITWCARIPHASLNVHINVVGLFAYYAVLVAFMAGYHKFKARKLVLEEVAQFALYKA
jgi:competence protein ComEC